VEFPEARIYEETLNCLLYENRTGPDQDLMQATSARGAVASYTSDDEEERRFGGGGGGGGGPGADGAAALGVGPGQHLRALVGDTKKICREIFCLNFYDF
jgi:hypothetical protein